MLTTIRSPRSTRKTISNDRNSNDSNNEHIYYHGSGFVFVIVFNPERRGFSQREGAHKDMRGAQNTVHFLLAPSAIQPCSTSIQTSPPFPCVNNSPVSSPGWMRRAVKVLPTLGNALPGGMKIGIVMGESSHLQFPSQGVKPWHRQ